MFHTILVPLDGSALSEQALPLALSLARQMNARIVLTQAVPLPSEPFLLEGAPFTVDEQVDRMIGYARQYLLSIQHQLRQELEPGTNPPDHNLDVSVYVLVSANGPAPAIADYADHIGANLIVMATHGHSGINRWAFGSVADKMMQLTNTPVVAVHPQSIAASLPETTPLKRILVPLDGSPLAEHVLPLACDMARSFDAELLLVRAATLPPMMYANPDNVLLQPPLWETAVQSATDYLTQKAGTLTAEGYRVRPLVVRENLVAQAILDRAAEHAVDLIAMTTHGYTGLRRLVYGSVADKVLRSGHHPVLIMRPPTT